MPRLGCTVFVIGCLIAPTASQAANITVSGDHPQHSITVTIEDATMEVVLNDLHKKYGFEVDGLKNADKGEALSATMTGSLQGILERLLRNWNHMIVRSPDNESGIAKVMILNSNYGAKPTRGRVGRASGDADDRLMQALSGGGID